MAVKKYLERLGLRRIMKELQLKNKKIVTEKLIPFGFTLSDGKYVYTTGVLDGQFTLELSVLGEDKISTRLTETDTGEEYTLHLYPPATGEFVGSVRAAYNAAVDKFINECCEAEVFKSRQAQEVIGYVKQTYGAAPEYLWDKFPDCAIFRRQDTQTWYGVLLTVSRAKLGFESNEIAEIIDLRIQPEELAAINDGKRYFAGYHMNKKSWLTIVLDGSVPVKELFERIDNSYNLAAKTKKQKSRRG